MTSVYGSLSQGRSYNDISDALLSMPAAFGKKAIPCSAKPVKISQHAMDKLYSLLERGRRFSAPSSSLSSISHETRVRAQSLDLGSIKAMEKSISSNQKGIIADFANENNVSVKDVEEALAHLNVKKELLEQAEKLNDALATLDALRKSKVKGNGNTSFQENMDKAETHLFAAQNQLHSILANVSDVMKKKVACLAKVELSKASVYLAQAQTLQKKEQEDAARVREEMRVKKDCDDMRDVEASVKGDAMVIDGITWH